jgi:YHS domain-containing protein
MAIDPICGMTVDAATARSGERDGKTFYFCSEHCRQKFLGNRAKKPSPKPSAFAMNRVPSETTFRRAFFVFFFRHCGGR